MRRPPSIADLAFVAALLIAALAPGCSELVCGEGTHEAAGECVPNILTVCGDGTVYDKGYCVPDHNADAGSAADDAQSTTVEDARDSR